MNSEEKELLIEEINLLKLRLAASLNYRANHPEDVLGFKIKGLGRGFRKKIVSIDSVKREVTIG